MILVIVTVQSSPLEWQDSLFLRGALRFVLGEDKV